MKATLQLRTMHGKSFVASNVIENLIVSDLEGGNKIELLKVFGRLEISVLHEQISKPDLVCRLPHLLQITSEMSEYMLHVRIGLLGNN